MKSSGNQTDVDPEGFELGQKKCSGSMPGIWKREQIGSTKMISGILDIKSQFLRLSKHNS